MVTKHVTTVVEALGHYRKPILAGVAAGIVIAAIGLLGSIGVNFLFPAEMPTSNALQILNAIISINGVLLGFLGIMLLLFFSSNDTAIDRARGVLPNNPGAWKKVEQLRSDRQIAVVFAAISFGMLVLSIIASITSMAAIPLGEQVQATRVGFIWPIGALFAGLITILVLLVSVGLSSSEY